MEEGRSELVIKYLQGQLDTQGINDFYTWVNENVENKKVFFEIKAVYDACYTNRMQNDMEGSWDRLLKKRKVFYPRKKSRWLQLGNYAAVSFITVCLTSLFLTFNKDEDKIATRYIGGDGLDADVVELPDGTQVCLGSKTVFHYENDYGRKERIVYLEGEAYFDVVHDENNKFVVNTGTVNVLVHGTSFSVTDYPTDSFISVALEKGSVSVETSREHDLLTRLVPGQKLLIAKSDISWNVSAFDAEAYNIWMLNKLQFKGESLYDVFRKIERWYGVKIRLENENPSYSYWFTLKTESLTEMLNLINQITPIDYKINGEEVTIRYK